MQEEQTKPSGRFKYFLIGGVVGAASALLFAPKSGRETREFISAKTRDSKDAVREGARTMSKKLDESKEHLREKVSDEKETLSTAYKAGKEAYQEEKKSANKK